MNMSNYSYHAIVNSEDYKVLREGSKRKALRRIARKRYSEDYSSSRVIIISGEDKKNAILNYKNLLKSKEEKKTDKKNKIKQTKVKKNVVKKKAVDKNENKKTTMLTAQKKEEKKTTARINKQNAKLAKLS